jgi:hypothetical protein
MSEIRSKRVGGAAIVAESRERACVCCVSVREGGGGAGGATMETSSSRMLKSAARLVSDARMSADTCRQWAAVPLSARLSTLVPTSTSWPASAIRPARQAQVQHNYSSRRLPVGEAEVTKACNTAGRARACMVCMRMSRTRARTHHARAHACARTGGGLAYRIPHSGGPRQRAGGRSAALFCSQHAARYICGATCNAVRTARIIPSRAS